MRGIRRENARPGAGASVVFESAAFFELYVIKTSFLLLQNTRFKSSNKYVECKDVLQYLTSLKEDQENLGL